MLVEAKRFLPRAMLVPFLAAGAMAFENIVSTSVAEAGGCQGDRVVTSGNISPEDFYELQQMCKQNALTSERHIAQLNQVSGQTTLSDTVHIATTTIFGLLLGAGTLGLLRKTVYKIGS